jgi:mono/diheme cytochrome c family protein
MIACDLTLVPQEPTLPFRQITQGFLRLPYQGGTAMRQLVGILVCLTPLVGVVLIPYAPPGQAQDVLFTAEFLNDPHHIALGKQLWDKRCRLCHGKETYPGAAPPLQPWKYTAEFVYDRITNGFRGMPALKEEFSEAERKAIVSYVLSRQFSP